MYYYDLYGWLTPVAMPDRATEVAPPEETAGLRANWTGEAWVLREYVAPPPQPEPPADPTAWLIDIGPFFDRFGAAKMAVLTSTDAGIKAILADTQVRKWIDLQRTDVAQSVAYIGSVVAAVTPALQTAILTAPVTHEENLALRKLYFS